MPLARLLAMSGDAAAAAGGDGRGGAPGAGAGAANDNINGGNSASQSNGGPFSGYILLLFPLLALSLYCYVRCVPVPDIHDASSMLLRYCNVSVPDIHDAHSMLLVMLRSPYTAYAMIIVSISWIKICRLMTIFPTKRRTR